MHGDQLGDELFTRYNFVVLRQKPPLNGLRARPLVGVVVDGVSTYGRGILRGVTRYANLQRRWLLYKDMRRVLDVPANWPSCDGVIVAGVGRSTIDFLRAHCKRVISCSGSSDPLEGPVVSLDDEAAGTMAAEHLLDCRLENFGFYGLAQETVAGKRLAGFRSALAAKGFSCIESPIRWPSSVDWMTHAHRPKLIEWLVSLPKPVGILAVDDTAAHDLSEACIEAEIAVPDHIAIVGVNNDDLLCEGAWPPLSSVEGDFSRVGYLAAKMLDRLFTGEELAPEERVMRLPPLGVVQRQSSNVLAIDDPNIVDALRFIREHACDPCSVQDVLREVPVGRRWLERQFLTLLDRTPHDEITRVRIDTARRLLLQPDLSLPEIASRCGFSEIKNFYRAFRSVTETTPAAFRRSALMGGRRNAPRQLASDAP